MIKLVLVLLFLIPSTSESTIMACSDQIEKMKARKDKEGLGDLGKAVCKNNGKASKARYKKDSEWECQTIEEFPCVDKKELRMVQCDREWECVK